MCGRYTLRTPAKHVVELFDLSLEEADLAILESPRYNIAPSQQVAAVRFDAERNARTLVALQWGLIPSFADDAAIGNRMINARAETVASKRAFREAFAKRRCLLPADGFFEWRQEDKSKQPYYIRLADDRPFALAGLWEHWQQGPLAIDSCTIITTEANDLVRPLHDRMPVVIAPENFARWLDSRIQDPKLLEPLLAPCPAAMTVSQVSRAVNSPRVDSRECIAPLRPEKTQGSLFD